VSNPCACRLVKEGDGATCPAGLAVPHGTVTTRRTLRSVAILVILGLLVTGANLLYTAHAVQDGNQDRCSTVVADATIPLPPAGSPGRQWEAAFEANSRDRARQLGCSGA
jgi:hypothetical protein